MFKSISTFLFALVTILCSGQISGIVTSSQGEPLAYATVYIEGTSTGASTNVSGYYSININQPTEVILICQYLGYQTVTKKVNYQKTKQTQDFILNIENILAPTLQVNANAEDPAYAIIRQAIKKRKYFSQKLQSLSYDAYIKGRFDIEQVPKMMLSVMEDGATMFDVDSSGRGIVYLSESESTFYKDRVDNVKEVMHSSKISGFDNQFSFNNAISMNFSIYDNQMEIIRDIISPISNNALFYYKYKLLGTTFDEKGRLLNKIQIIPKSKTSPTFSGVIYVTENDWSVPQGELILTSDHSQQALVDSVRLVYSSIEVEKDTWVDLKKYMWMRIKAFGFSAGGSFNGVFDNFNINPAYEKNFFNRELFKIEEGANRKSNAYWDSIRPLPLTVMEEVNYVTMDSLKVVRKRTVDSMVNNPAGFKFKDILNGYQRYFDKGRLELNYLPIDQAGLNVVQGYFLGLAARLYTNPDSFHRPSWNLHGSLDYGFSEKQIRGSAYYTRSSNSTSPFSWTIEAGRFIQQYREIAPAHSMANTIYSLLQEKNISKFIEQDALGFEGKKEWLNGISIRGFAEIGRRHALVNNTDYSWAKASKTYDSNTPLNPGFYEPAFQSNTHVIFGLQANFKFDQKYLSMPNRVFKFDSKYPVVSMGAAYDYNFENESNYAHLQIGLIDAYDMNVVGDGGWNMHVGAFFIDKPAYFMDFKHFDGNQTIFGSPSTYRSSFQLLPYYSHSTNDKYLEGHIEHHFRGFILDKVPLVRLLKWNLAAGLNYLYTPEHKSYSELYLGVENIGVSFFRFLRFDIVLALDEDRNRRVDYVIGLSLDGFTRFGSNNRKKIKTKF